MAQILAADYSSKSVNAFWKIGVRVVFLMVAAVVLGAITWFIVDFVENGIDARMMAAFESNPAEGHDYWWWHFFKESLPSNLPVFAALAVMWGGLIWSGVSTFKKAIRKF